MSDHPRNPYQAPKEGPLPSVSPKPLLPPIAPVRLIIALVLVTVAWTGIWAKVREGIALGFLIAMCSFAAASWVANPATRKWNTPVMPRHLFWIVIVSAGVLSLVISLNKWEPPLWFTEAIIHPVMLVFGWLLNCGVMVIAWWKRRNNPPYQPDPPSGQSGTAGSSESVPDSPENW